MLCLNVDDGFCAGDKVFESSSQKYYKHFKVNPEKVRKLFIDVKVNPKSVKIN